MTGKCFRPRLRREEAPSSEAPPAPLRAGHQRRQRRRPSRTSRDSALTFNAGKAGPQGATQRDPGAGCRGGARRGASGRVWAWLVATRGRRCFYWHRGAGDKEAGRWPTTRRTAPWEAKVAPQTSTALRLLGKRRKCVTAFRHRRLWSRRQTTEPGRGTASADGRPGSRPCGCKGWRGALSPSRPLFSLQPGPGGGAGLTPPRRLEDGRKRGPPDRLRAPWAAPDGLVHAGSLQPRDRGAEMLPAVTARSGPRSAAGAAPGPTTCSAAHSGTRRRGRSRHAESRVFVMNGYGPKPASGRDAEGGGPGTPGPAGSGPPPGGRRGTELSQRWW